MLSVSLPLESCRQARREEAGFHLSYGLGLQTELHCILAVRGERRVCRCMYQRGWSCNGLDRTPPGNLNVLSLEGFLPAGIPRSERFLESDENLPLKRENVNRMNAVRRHDIPSYGGAQTSCHKIRVTR